MTRTLSDKRKSNGRTLALDGKAWRTLRAAVLREQPLCAVSGCHEWAVDVDHIDNDPTNNDRDNLAGLCHGCHSRKTQLALGGNVSYGCDVHGYPLDPSHLWNSEKSLATDGGKPTGAIFFPAKAES